MCAHRFADLHTQHIYTITYATHVCMHEFFLNSVNKYFSNKILLHGFVYLPLPVHPFLCRPPILKFIASIYLIIVEIYKHTHIYTYICIYTYVYIH